MPIGTVRDLGEAESPLTFQERWSLSFETDPNEKVNMLKNWGHDASRTGDRIVVKDNQGVYAPIDPDTGFFSDDFLGDVGDYGREIIVGTGAGVGAGVGTLTGVGPVAGGMLGAGVTATALAQQARHAGSQKPAVEVAGDVAFEAATGGVGEALTQLGTKAVAGAKRWGMGRLDNLFGYSDEASSIEQQKLGYAAEGAGIDLTDAPPEMKTGHPSVSQMAGNKTDPFVRNLYKEKQEAMAEQITKVIKDTREDIWSRTASSKLKFEVDPVTKLPDVTKSKFSSEQLSGLIFKAVESQQRRTKAVADAMHAQMMEEMPLGAGTPMDMSPLTDFLSRTIEELGEGYAKRGKKIIGPLEELLEDVSGWDTLGKYERFKEILGKDIYQSGDFQGYGRAIWANLLKSFEQTAEIVDVPGVSSSYKSYRKIWEYHNKINKSPMVKSLVRRKNAQGAAEADFDLMEAVNWVNKVGRTKSPHLMRQFKHWIGAEAAGDVPATKEGKYVWQQIQQVLLDEVLDRMTSGGRTELKGRIGKKFLADMGSVNAEGIFGKEGAERLAFIFDFLDNAQIRQGNFMPKGSTEGDLFFRNAFNVIRGMSDPKGYIKDIGAGMGRRSVARRIIKQDDALGNLYVNGIIPSTEDFMRQMGMGGGNMVIAKRIVGQSVAQWFKPDPGKIGDLSEKLNFVPGAEAAGPIGAPTTPPTTPPPGEPFTMEDFGESAQRAGAGRDTITARGSWERAETEPLTSPSPGAPFTMEEFGESAQRAGAGRDTITARGSWERAETEPLTLPPPGKMYNVISEKTPGGYLPVVRTGRDNIPRISDIPRFKPFMKSNLEKWDELIIPAEGVGYAEHSIKKIAALTTSIPSSLTNTVFDLIKVADEPEDVVEPTIMLMGGGRVYATETMEGWGWLEAKNRGEDLSQQSKYFQMAMGMFYDDVTDPNRLINDPVNWVLDVADLLLVGGWVAGTTVVPALAALGPGPLPIVLLRRAKRLNDLLKKLKASARAGKDTQENVLELRRALSDTYKKGVDLSSLQLRIEARIYAHAEFDLEPKGGSPYRAKDRTGAEEVSQKGESTIYGSSTDEVFHQPLKGDVNVPHGEMEDWWSHAVDKFGDDPTPAQLLQTKDEFYRGIGKKPPKWPLLDRMIEFAPIDKITAEVASVLLKHPEFRLWYDKFNKTIRKSVGENMEEFSGVFAVTSAQNYVESNLADTFIVMKWYRQYMAERKGQYISDSPPLGMKKGQKKEWLKKRRPKNGFGAYIQSRQKAGGATAEEFPTVTRHELGKGIVETEGSRFTFLSSEAIYNLERFYDTGIYHVGEKQMKTKTYGLTASEKAKRDWFFYAVNDTWMGKVFGVTNQEWGQPHLYRYASYVQALIAKNLGVSVDEVQAMLWWKYKSDMPDAPPDKAIGMLGYDKPLHEVKKAERLKGPVKDWKETDEGIKVRNEGVPKSKQIPTDVRTPAEISRWKKTESGAKIWKALQIWKTTKAGKALTSLQKQALKGAVREAPKRQTWPYEIGDLKSAMAFAQPALLRFLEIYNPAKPSPYDFRFRFPLKGKRDPKATDIPEASFEIQKGVYPMGPKVAGQMADLQEGIRKKVGPSRSERQRGFEEPKAGF